MPKILKLGVSLLLLVSGLLSLHGAQERGNVVERVRVELAKVLKKDAAKVPVDKPVTEIGASELDVVEWVMAVEREFHINIRDEKITDPKTKSTRKDVSVVFMAKLVNELLDAPKGKR